MPIADVMLFDVYTGEGVPGGFKSLALTVTLQPVTATLTEAEIDAVAQKIVAAVAKETKGTVPQRGSACQRQSQFSYVSGF